MEKVEHWGKVILVKVMTMSQQTISDFAKLLFEHDDIIEFRLLPGGDSTWHVASELHQEAPRLIKLNEQGQNIYFGANPRKVAGGTKNDDILLARCLFADFDNTEIETVRRKLEDLGLPYSLPTLILNSGHGVHVYYRLDEPLYDLSKYTRLMKRLAKKLGSDPKVCDPARLMRLPGCMNHKPPVAKSELIEASDRRHRLIDFNGTLPPLEERKPPPPKATTSPMPADMTNIEARAIAYLAKCPPAISGAGGHNQTFSVARALVWGFALAPEKAQELLLAHYNPACQPPWSEKELRHKCQEADTKLYDKPRGYLLNEELPQGKPFISTSTPSEPIEGGSPEELDTWPQLREEAYHGIAGRIVRSIEPHTESDPEALLVQLLVACGNIIGRTAHFKVDGCTHYLNLFAVLVGQSSKARKGTSWSRIKQYMEAVDAEWISNRVQSGLVSGEGMVDAVRDPVIGREVIKHDRRIIGYQDVEIDPGVADKRLLCTEAEYANVLKMMDRDGNSLSARIREAWEGSSLGSLTKSKATRCRCPHISIIGHVTDQEIRRYLTVTESANGFGNRHLWLMVRRSKLLPEGGSYEPEILLVQELNRTLTEARTMGELTRDEEARTLWYEVYGPLSEGKPGLTGIMLGRAEAQVMRMACLYAVLDRSLKITASHLRAALALWDYCEASVRSIFGDATGDDVADTILQALRENSNGLTRTQISQLFQRNKSSGRIDTALAMLLQGDMAEQFNEATGGGPREIWKATTKRTK